MERQGRAEVLLSVVGKLRSTAFFSNSFKWPWRHDNRTDDSDRLG